MACFSWTLVLDFLRPNTKENKSNKTRNISKKEEVVQYFHVSNISSYYRNKHCQPVKGRDKTSPDKTRLNLTLRAVSEHELQRTLCFVRFNGYLSVTGTNASGAR